MGSVVAAAGFSLLALAHSALGERTLLRPLFARPWELGLPRPVAEPRSAGPAPARRIPARAPRLDPRPVAHRIGLVALSTDHTIEVDFARILAPAGVAVYVSRIPFANPVTPETLPMIEAWAQAVPVAERPHRLLARYYLDRGDAESQDLALPHLEFLDARAQYTPAYAAALAKRYAEIGEKEKAVLKAERAVSIAPYDADQRELAARVALVAGNYKDAERHLDALTKIEPDIKQHATRLARVRELLAKQ